MVATSRGPRPSHRAAPEAAPGPRSARRLRVALGRRPPRPAAGSVLLVALVLVGLGAAVLGGAYGSQAAGLTVAAGVAVALVATAWVGGARPELLPTGRVGVGVAALAGLAAWALCSTAWALAPDRAWVLGGKLALVALCAVLAAVAARSVPRARERAAELLLAAALLLVALALGGRLLPGGTEATTTFAGVAEATRLRGPLGYWNAFGLVAATAGLLLLRLAVDRHRAPAQRLLAGAALAPALAALVMAESRGALLALLGGLVVLAWGGGARLRAPALLVVALLAAVPAAVAGAGMLSGDRVVPVAGPAGFGVALLLSAVAGAAATRLVVVLERRVPWGAGRSRGVLAFGAAAVVAVALVLAVGGTVREGGPGPAARALAERVVAPDRAGPVAGQGRLLSVSSSRRADWWAEALGAWTARPVQGWGAGSFGVVRLRYRQDQTDVAQPHAVPLQLLVELGVAGALLGGIAAALLAQGAWRRLREDPRADPGRSAGAALLAAAAAWFVQSLVDWDMDIPGVTVPAVVGLVVAAAAPPRRALAAGPEEAGEPADRPVDRLDARETPRALPRLALTAAAAVALSGLLVGALLPVLGERRTDRALDAAATDPAGQRRAVADAALAARLDPFGVRPLRALATAERARGQRLLAREAALRAVRRAPDDPAAWRELVVASLALADRSGARVAALRMVALDPVGLQTVLLAARVEAELTPPAASPSAIGTPVGGDAERLRTGG